MTRQQITIIGIAVIAIAVVLVGIIGLGPTFSTSKTTKSPSSRGEGAGDSVVGKAAPGEKIIVLSKLGMV